MKSKFPQMGDVFTLLLPDEKVGNTKWEINQIENVLVKFNTQKPIKSGEYYIKEGSAIIYQYAEQKNEIELLVSLVGNKDYYNEMKIVYEVRSEFIMPIEDYVDEFLTSNENSVIKLVDKGYIYRTHNYDLFMKNKKPVKMSYYLDEGDKTGQFKYVMTFSL